MNGNSLIKTFPNLDVTGYIVTSPPTINYNCIAWAACDADNWWEPDCFFQYYWPTNVPREYTLKAYIIAFESVGFVVCKDGILEAGYEKISIYYDAFGNPKHAARQLPSGKWTSKLGNCEDIEHPVLESLYGLQYGSVVTFMKRKLK